MKIYYASQSFYPHIGGVSTYLLNLCNEMFEKGNEVVEVHLRPSGEEDNAELKGIEIKRVPKTPIDSEVMQGYSKFKEAIYKGSHYGTFEKPVEEMQGYIEYKEVNDYFGQEIQALLEEDAADIVHIHDFQLLYAYKYVPRGTPLILTWHIPLAKSISKNLADFLIKNMNEYDKVVFSSQEYIDVAVKNGLDKEKAVLIHPIANTNLFRKLDVDKEKVREKYNLPLKDPVIMSVQRVDPKSGHEQLIKALKYVKKDIPNAKLVFVGGDSLSNKLSKDREKLKKDILKLIKDLELTKDVIFTGTIDYHELPELYNSIDINALCSKNEGFGLAITEGMACGKPIVGTKVGGIPIQVQDKKNGFLVEVGDYKETANSIIKILKDEKLKEKMSEKSLEIVENHFSIKVGVEKHLILYNQLISQKNEFHQLKYFDTSEISGFITDMDGTITDKPAKHDFDSKDFDLNLLKRMNKLDMDLYLATGRTVKYVRNFARRFNIWRAIIAENGAVIYFPETRKTLTFNTSYMNKAKLIVKRSGVEGAFAGKIIASFPIKYKDYFFEKFGELLNHLDYTINCNEINVLPKGVNKSIGIIMAMKYLNVDLDKTIVVGDGENDIEMFQNPGFKIALANSHEKLKSLANQITAGASTKGVKEILDVLESNKNK